MLPETDAANLIGVADVKHTPRIPLNPNRIARRTRWRKIETSVVEVRDLPDVVLSFGKARDAVVARHRSLPRVISGQGQIHVTSIAFQKRLQMPHTRIHVLLRVKRIL